MATVFIPTMLQTITGGVKQAECEGRNVRQIIERLEELYPGIRDRLVEDGEIRPNLAVAIDGDVARMGMLEKVGETSEIHFVPAIGGGAGESASGHLPGPDGRCELTAPIASTYNKFG